MGHHNATKASLLYVPFPKRIQHLVSFNKMLWESLVSSPEDYGSTQTMDWALEKFLVCQHQSYGQYFLYNVYEFQKCASSYGTHLVRAITKFDLASLLEYLLHIFVKLLYYWPPLIFQELEAKFISTGHLIYQKSFE